MKFSMSYQTTWHDTDLCRRVRPSQILVYMQETSNRHMASCGMTLDQLRDEKGLAFILSRISIAYHRPLYFEYIADGRARKPYDLLVCVNKASAQPLGNYFTDRGLARCGHTDKHDVLLLPEQSLVYYVGGFLGILGIKEDLGCRYRLSHQHI